MMLPVTNPKLNVRGHMGTYERRNGDKPSGYGVSDNRRNARNDAKMDNGQMEHSLLNSKYLRGEKSHREMPTGEYHTPGRKEL